MRSFKTESAAETIALGEEIGRKLSPGAVVALNGGLGAGKTWLSKRHSEGVRLRRRRCEPDFHYH